MIYTEKYTVKEWKTNLVLLRKKNIALTLGFYELSSTTFFFIQSESQKKISQRKHDR